MVLLTPLAGVIVRKRSIVCSKLLLLTELMFKTWEFRFFLFTIALKPPTQSCWQSVAWLAGW